MTLGFLIQRNIYYKHFGSLIDEVLQRGHRVFCFHDYHQPKTGPKGYQFPHLRQAPHFKNGLAQAIAYNSPDDLANKASQNKIEAMVSLHFVEQYQPLRNLLKKAGIKWVSIQHGLDSIVWADKMGEPDLYLFYSQQWLEFAFEYLQATEKPFDRQALSADRQALSADRQAIAKKAVFVGFSELDQVKLTNPYAIKAKWGIPDNQKVVLFLPFPFGATNDRLWAKYIFGGGAPLLAQPFLALFTGRIDLLREVFKKQNDKRFCLLLKDFCKRNDAFLLVKSRKKDPVKPYLVKLADKVLYDEQDYPSTIIECLVVADLCLNFLSTAVMESIALAVPNVSVLPPENYKDINNPLWKLLLSKYRALFDFKGVSRLVALRDIFQLLQDKTLNDFAIDKQAQEMYCKKYIGPNEPAKKAIDAIGKIV